MRDQNQDLDNLAERARAAIVDHATVLVRRGCDPDVQPPYIFLDLPCTLFMIRTEKCAPCPPDALT